MKQRNYVKKAMDKLCKPSYIPHKKGIKTRENDMENMHLDLDSYHRMDYDVLDEKHPENQGEEE